MHASVKLQFFLTKIYNAFPNTQTAKCQPTTRRMSSLIYQVYKQKNQGTKCFSLCWFIINKLSQVLDTLQVLS